ncbi:MAG: sodium/proton-translocating pyrophosphatase [Capsulimonadaceae bacterium]|nr:sodium/proton-translocating pyrophosphatase [Capsulimonadaceae bacterium]
MSSDIAAARSHARARIRRYGRIALLAFLVVTLAVFTLAGPKLLAQSAPAAARPITSSAISGAAAQPLAAPLAISQQTGKTGQESTHGEAVKLPFGDAATLPLMVVLASAFLALGFGFYWWRKTVAQDPGNERMRGCAAAVQEGALAYLGRQIRTMIPLVAIIGIGLFFLYQGQYDSTVLGAGVALAFILGVTASYLAGFVGMSVAVRGNCRVANAALSSFKRALETAFQAGAVSGMFTVGLGLLGATITFLVFKQDAMFVLVGFGFGGSLAALFMRVGGGIFTKAADVGADLVGKVEAAIPEDDPRNAATIADNVGDNVGDCAGMAADVFESYEVTLVASIILAAAVGNVLQAAGYGAMLVHGTFTFDFTLSLVIYALLVRAVGVVASIVGVLSVRGKDDPSMNPMTPINLGFMVSAIVASIGFVCVGYGVFHAGRSFDFAATPYSAPPSVVGQLENSGIDSGLYMTAAVDGVKTLIAANPKSDLSFTDLDRIARSSAPEASSAAVILGATPALGADGVEKMVSGIKSHEVLASKVAGGFWWMAILATLAGIILTQVIGKLTEYFTGDDKKPVAEIALSARTGPATLILAGLAEGLESSVWGIVAIAATITGAFLLFPNPAMAAYAIALSGLGLLATTGYVLAMDTFGPISDNANGIFEMSGSLKNEDGTENTAASAIVARLDMVGNTTKALTKGFAIATAVIAAVALYRSFLDTAAVKDPSILTKNIPVNMPDVFVGLLLGGAVPFLFSSFAIRAVSRAAVQLVQEVRRQFRTIPGIWSYQGVGEYGKPDYARCVGISTAAAQKELLGPGLLAICSPIFVGFALGACALGGFLAGAILSGQLMAVFMSNTGGAWDNAKKKIEDGFLGGKGTEAHKAGVIGDTVGDPLKDTAGPGLNPMIKVMNLVAILVAPSTVMFSGKPIGWIVVAVTLSLLAGAVVFSKRGGPQVAEDDGEPSFLDDQAPIGAPDSVEDDKLIGSGR